MAISLVTLVDTFLSWMNKTNELITVANLSTEGQANSTGTLKLTNAGGVGSGVTLNVSSGLIKGDGGLLTNVATVIADATVTNAKLANSYIKFISNSATLVVSGGNNANLGATVYFDVGTLSSRTNDQSTANIASANAVNAVHMIAVGAYAQANSGAVAGPAFDKANAANVIASGAYDKANAANLFAFTVNANTNATLVIASGAFNKANAANVIASAAFDTANNATGGGYFKGNRGTIGNANNIGDIFRVNHAYMNANVTIDATERAIAVGPLVVNTGIVLTITTGGRAVIA